MFKNFSIYLIAAMCFSFAPSAVLAESALEWEHVRSGRVLIRLNQALPILPKAMLGPPLRTGLAELDRILIEIDATGIIKALPRHQPHLYLVTFDEVHSVEGVISVFRGWSGIVSVWPCLLVPWHELQFIPADLLLPSQWHLSQIKAPQAWAISRGGPSVQVAIIDGGVNYMHPDLGDNIWINPGEDLNGDLIIEDWEWDGQDNDGNGFVDDFWGWDWIDLDSSAVWPGEDPGPPDNDPSDFDGHGTHCAGDACAVTDNGLGVASPGFDCQIMALRAGYLSQNGMGYVDMYAAMQAVYYAIDMEAEVISMSFGGTSPVPYFRSALEAANSAGLVLVASAGNESISQINYPAGYSFVIAVAATAPGDYLADFTNYGDWITVSAPGEAILSTYIEGWGNMGGTSMAAPITAGLCAMVKALMPDWGSVPVGEWLALTADNINAQNPGYVGMMGGGRINAAKAVDLFVTVDSLWTENPQGGDRLQFDEEGSLLVRYHKYFGDAYDVNLEISSSNPRVTFTQANHYIGALMEGEVGDNTGSPFTLIVQVGDRDFEMIEVEAHFSGEGFDFTQILEVPVGRGRVLIIDADQNQEEQTAVYYQRALANLGYSWETWKREDREQLGEELLQYEAIIHFSGTAETNIFPANDWNDLENYLDNGGNLIITGQNVAQDLVMSQPEVLTNILRVEYLQPHSNILTIRGTPGNPLTEGMYLVMAGAAGAWNQSSLDVVSALPGAESFFIYRLNLPDELAGVRVESGRGDLFYCTFGIEGINDSTSAGNTRAEVLGMMLEQFGLTIIAPTAGISISAQIYLYPPYPNPFNAQVKITYQLKEPGPITVAVYDVLGREVAGWHQDHAPAGPGEWYWRADAEVSSGIYFVRLQASCGALQRKTIYLK